MSFENLASVQSGVAATLAGYREKNRIPHALLFSGAPDSGQLEAAAEFARQLFCRSPKKDGPCGECPDCRQVAANGHADYVVIRPEEGHALKVEAVRELIAKAALKPFQAPAKVLVIDQADHMQEIAQSALLKTLEEPPAHTYFIVISYANEKLLPTIRSRTQVLHFAPLARDKAHEAQVQGARHDLLTFICGESDWKTSEALALEREEVMKALDLVIADVRHLLLMRVNAGHLLGLIEDKPLKERALARFSEEELLDLLELLAEFKDKLLSSANLKLALSVLKDELSAVKR